MSGAIFNGNIHAICIAAMMVVMILMACIWEFFTTYLVSMRPDPKRARAGEGLGCCTADPAHPHVRNT